MIWVFAAFLGLILAFITLLLVPIRLEATKCAPDLPGRYCLTIALVHPRFAEFSLALPSEQVRLNFLGRTIYSKLAVDDDERRGESSGSDEEDPRRAHKGYPSPDDREGRSTEEAMRESAEPRSESEEKESSKPRGTAKNQEGEVYPRTSNHLKEFDEEELTNRHLPETGRHEDQRTTMAKDSEKTSSRKSPWRRIREHRLAFLLNQRQWIGKVLHWVVRVVRSFLALIVFDECRLVMKGGTGNHAVTGMLSGAYWGIMGVLRSTRVQGINLNYEPTFGQTLLLRWNGAIRLHTSLGRLVWPLAVALGSFPYMSSFLTWRRLKGWERENNPASSDGV
ncbi:MAG: hypothetical protein GF344_17720 [Chitinivibrionales bacterium]|nr:hypothetical protein [Chitinivibrionales bacterium]MBD3358507.1 hypothetical protein [Chitinivibrionales bacterium]